MKPVDEELELARLLASEASPLGASLSALRERGPDASELGLLASRLSLGGVDVTVPPKAPTAAQKPWKTWSLAGGGVGAAAGLLWLALRGTALAPVSGSDGNAPASARVFETTRKQAAPPQPPARRDGGGARPEGVAPRSATPNATPNAAVANDDALSLAETNARALVPTGERDRTASSPAAPDSVAPSAASRGPSSPAGSAVVAAPASSSAAGAPSEIELLRDARLALRQSPSAALTFAEQHARLYPQGKLSQERELIAISALVASGRRTAALSRGARFEQVFPTSPYRKQLGDLLK